MLRTNQRIYLVWKRLCDIGLSFLSLLLFSPLLLICFLITLLDSKGHPIFRQERLGKNEKVFRILKFRSMKRGSVQVDPYSISKEDLLKMTTKWGAFMRRSSIDELPQLLNILVGQMSFIGPRPSQCKSIEPALVDLREKACPSPYLVKPGLSGYAQLKLLSSPSVEEKARLDSEYVKRMSLGLDFCLFWKSLFIGFLPNKGHR